MPNINFYNGGYVGGISGGYVRSDWFISTEKQVPYLFIGGYYDGVHLVVNTPSYVVFYPVPAPMVAGAGAMFTSLWMEQQKYTRRKFTNPSGKSFTIMALESMRGEEVLMELAKGIGKYKNNPLFEK